MRGGNKKFQRRGFTQRTNINGRIRAREVRVVGTDGSQLGVLAINKAIELAKKEGVDLVEVASKAKPPVCRLIDYGKYRYEQSKKKKENKKAQSANKIKEVQLRPNIDPHDLEVKRHRAVDFLCQEMKVRIILRYRGREMAHQEIGMQLIRKFVDGLEIFGHADGYPKKMGRRVSVLINPLPKQKRALNPYKTPPPEDIEDEEFDDDDEDGLEEELDQDQDDSSDDQFTNSPFDAIESPDPEDKE